MYNVNGKRKKESAKLVCDAIIEISKQKDFDDITISEISKLSTISRNTIYRLFDSKEDILEYIVNDYMNEVMYQYNTLVEYNVTEHSYDMIYQSYLNYFTIWEREKQILQIMKRCNKLHYLYPMIEKSVVNKNSDYIISQIKTVDHFNEYYYGWLSGSITSILIKWVNYDFQETPEQLTEIMMQLFKSVNYKFWHNT